MAGAQPTQNIPKRMIRRRRAPAIPEYVIDPILLKNVLSASSLPSTYSFEIVKTVQRCVKEKATHVALQMPEGLLIYATVIGDVLIKLTPRLEKVSVLSDVTYGACCVDDITAEQLGCQLLIHYGHSCLVPLQHTVIPVLYVFVEVEFDVNHLVGCLLATLKNERPRIALLGTIQFRHSLAEISDLLKAKGFDHVDIPQVKPLSPGETLGCTSPVITKPSVVCFVADGRFHLESTLISNPLTIVACYRYDPYGQTITVEAYDHDSMHKLRKDSIEKASSASLFGIILGTLGRQGNPAIVSKIQALLRQHGKKSYIVLLSEISPAKLCLMSADAWVQVACPRLSVDWGHHLSDRPVLSPYELFALLGETSYNDSYPMDYYSINGGPWSNYHEDNRDRQWKGSESQQSDNTSHPN